jgi:pimeloyl-ACP methyl ester carboxylesterase
VAARHGLILLLLLLLAGCGTSPRARAGHPKAGHYAALNGIRVYYETYGKGPVLVLLHGGAGSGAQFEKQVPALSAQFRLVVPDACAQGRTSDRKGPLTYHAMAEDVRALLDHLHVKKASVLGWSDGGDVALDLAMHHPERVDRVVTFGANFRADGLNPPDVAWNRTATAADFGDDMRKFYDSVAPDTAHYEIAMNKVIALWRDEPNWNEADLGIGHGLEHAVVAGSTTSSARTTPRRSRGRFRTRPCGSCRRLAQRAAGAARGRQPAHPVFPDGVGTTSGRGGRARRRGRTDRGPRPRGRARGRRSVPGGRPRCRR